MVVACSEPAEVCGAPTGKRLKKALYGLYATIMYLLRSCIARRPNTIMHSQNQYRHHPSWTEGWEDTTSFQNAKRKLLKGLHSSRTDDSKKTTSPLVQMVTSWSYDP
ncbi:hypothetical protein RRG08_010988 [Elysia crispata]|uniref:Uncharacterized protein n=1 Tax=Elysia crispata TaxID=231223 RepID=A0AAE0ZR47_9GAST|nr:hypothetical protein RRG08_010988 [Elysia crispata]